MEPELYDAYRALDYDAADQMELNFDDPDEQPMFDFTADIAAESTTRH